MADLGQIVKNTSWWMQSYEDVAHWKDDKPSATLHRRNASMDNVDINRCKELGVSGFSKRTRSKANYIIAL